MSLHFSKEEFLDRKTKVLKSMKGQGLDALLMFRQESMYWLTGYDTFGYVFFQTLIFINLGLMIFWLLIKKIIKSFVSSGKIPLLVLSFPVLI